MGLDNLMLTHGWSRFHWKDLSPKKDIPPTLFLPEINGHIITGLILNKENKIQPNISTFLSTPSKNINLYPFESNEEGKVFYEMIDFYGEKKILIQVPGDTSNIYKIKVDNPFYSSYPPSDLGTFKLKNALEKTILSRSMAMQASTLYFKEENQKLILPTIDSVSFFGKPNEAYYLDDYTRFQVMEEVLREYVPTVWVRKKKDQFHFMLIDQINKSVFQENPLILLDGVPIFHVNKIMEIDPLKIKKLEVINKQFFMGKFSFKGIVSFKTYNGDLSDLDLDPKIFSLDYEGLQINKEFFSPKYETIQKRESRLPDPRWALFWDPKITTDDHGKYKVEFYTSDVEGSFQMNIQGLTQQGDPVSHHASFVVKNENHP